MVASEGLHKAFCTSRPALGKAVESTPGLGRARVLCFKEVDTELGMDRDEGRKLGSRHPSMLATCARGRFFLWHLQIRLGE